jgi:predicted amidohydrolase
VLADALEAAKRDLLIDVGHGGGSFEYTVCAPVLQQGLMPDIITRACLLRAVTLSTTLTHGSVRE